jgi:glycyl-tRNA synthetase beta chain
VQAVVTRASRLADKGDLGPDVLSSTAAVNPNLFERNSETAMLAVLERLEPMACGNTDDRYAALARELSESADVLAAFFDGEESVMVMVEDPALRSNRLNLLAVLRNQASVLADFSRLNG